MDRRYRRQKGEMDRKEMQSKGIDGQKFTDEKSGKKVDREEQKGGIDRKEKQTDEIGRQREKWAKGIDQQN